MDYFIKHHTNVKRMLIDALIENEIICIVSNLSKNHINNPYLYDNLLYPSI